MRSKHAQLRAQQRGISHETEELLHTYRSEEHTSELQSH